MSQHRLLAGESIVLSREDEALGSLEVTVSKSRGWGELLEVQQRRPDGGFLTGMIVAQPSGSWWWVRELEPCDDEDGG